MDMWLHGFPLVGSTVPLAVRAERQGYHGLLLADSQLLVGDPYVESGLSAAATSTLQVGVAVTNPVTRHPSVTASSILTVHAESGGRAVLGFGRGDSSVRLIGRQPATLAQFRQALSDIRRYLGASEEEAPESTASPLSWLPPGVAKVPVDVAATGPAMIALGAARADRLTFNLGADPDRLRWAVTVAREARQAAGLGLDGFSLGAYVDVACNPDREEAIDMVRGSASIFVNFLAEGARAGVPLRDDDRAVVTGIASAYAETSHGLTSSPQAGEPLLSAAFLERFALTGAPEHLVDRIHELESLGLDRLIMVPASRDIAPHRVAASTDLFATHVLPRT